MTFSNLDKYRIGGSGTKMQLSIPVPRTPSGRAYRYSPNEEAHPRHFVIGDAVRPTPISDAMRARMKQEPGRPITVCPYSGVMADDGAFLHPDDRTAAIETVRHAAVSDIHAQLAEMLGGIGSRSRGLIKVSTSPSPPTPTPRFYREDLLRELVCDQCGRDYGVFAIALFCPDCGAPNVRLHFEREAALVDAQVELADGVGADLRELAYRLLGNAHEDVLTGMEATLKTVYLFGKRQLDADAPLPKVGNDFQNIERGQKRFAELGINPYGVLDDAELALLGVNIQKRHIIGHNLSVVDAKFAGQAADARLGETVSLVGDDVRAFARLALAVVAALDDWLAGQTLPTRVREARAEPASSAEAESPQANEERRARELGILPLSYRLGAWLSAASADGLERYADDQALAAAFAEVPEADMREAVAELETDGYVSSRRFLGQRGVPPIGRRLQLFLTFDPLVGDDDPTRDATELAERVRGQEGGVSTRELHAEIGWPLRRFNPALARMVRELDQRHVSKTGDGTYLTQHFHVNASDRVALRRFIERHQPRRT